MAKYKSQYKELAFFVEGVAHKFRSGHYETNDAKTIEVLDGLTYARKLEEAKEPTKTAKEEPKGEDKVNEEPKEEAKPKRQTRSRSTAKK